MLYVVNVYWVIINIFINIVFISKLHNVIFNNNYIIFFVSTNIL